MHGGSVEHQSPDGWKLVWSEEAIRDFYLNNILIHELGHLVDTRNTRYVDRERFASGFRWAGVTSGASVWRSANSRSAAGTTSPGVYRLETRLRGLGRDCLAVAVAEVLPCAVQSPVFSVST